MSTLRDSTDAPRRSTRGGVVEHPELGQELFSAVGIVTDLNERRAWPPGRCLAAAE